MNDIKSLSVGGLLLALVVVFAGVFWLRSNGDATGEPGIAPFAPVADLVVPPVPDASRERIPLDHAGPISMTVYQGPQCGCCGLWIEHMKEFGFEAEVHYRNDLGEVKQAFGIRPELSSCHTAIVNGYIVEGHVPGDVVRRFLAEAPSARGLTVPGMPTGSPGMEVPGGRVDDYSVYLFTASGDVQIYSRHGPAADAN
jgi:hypothetical protein